MGACGGACEPYRTETWEVAAEPRRFGDHLGPPTEPTMVTVSSTGVWVYTDTKGIPSARSKCATLVFTPVFTPVSDEETQVYRPC